VNVAELHERLRLAGEEWADLDAAATLLEELKKVTLAQIMSQHAGMSNAAAETAALASEAYTEHLGKMTRARNAANKALVKYKSAQMYVELMRTEAATRRAEMGLK
jgi:hypothetical protein